MSRIAKGSFQVRMTPAAEPDAAGGVALGRMTLEKTFEGDLAATGAGTMLTAMTSVQGSAVYVAIERVTGTLHGRTGSFALHHTGVMTRGESALAVAIVPDSGTGELAGIAGSLRIVIEGKQHFYELDYALGGGSAS